MKISTYDLQNVGLMLVNNKVYDPEALPEDENEFIEFAKHMVGDKDFWDKSKYYPKLLDILKKYVVFVDGKHKVVYKEEEIKIGLYMLRQLELNIPPKLALSILDTLPKPKLNSTSFRVYFSFTNVERHRDALYKLNRLIRLKPDLTEKIKNHPWIKILNIEINTFIKKDILPITYANLDDLLTKKTQQNWYSISEFFRNSLRTINEVIWVLPKDEELKIRKTVFSHFYNDFVPGGPMTPERENGIRVWKDIVQTVFDFLNSEDKSYW